MKKNIIFSITSALLAVLLASCTHDPSIAPRTDIHLDSNTVVGKYLVDKDGRALYFFANDVTGQSTCTGGCLTNWRIYYADTVTTTYTDGLLASDFKTATLTSGEKQTTYKGWPLYNYAPGGVPEAARETKGEGFNNIWFVAKTNYAIMIANYQLTDATGVNYLNNYTAGTGPTNYFTDGKGNTIYTFVKDSAFINKSNNNASFPIYETDNLTVPSTLDKSLFTLITYNGKKELTYKGWPLYYYAPDNFVRGSNKGFKFPASQPAGAIWPVAVKDLLLAPRL